MRTSIIMALALLIPAAAQGEGWTKSADLTLNLNQASYNDAWTGGEKGSITWAFVGNMTAEKALSPKFNWRNTLKLNYGQTHTQEVDDSGEKYWEAPEKSSDRIFHEALFRMTLGKLVDPYASLTFESQFYDASVEEVIRYLNPMTFSEAVGVGRTLVKEEQVELMSRVGFSVRQHVTKDVVPIEPEETETNTTVDGGLEWVTDYAHTFGEGKLKLVSKMRVFEALFNSESDELEGLENEDDWKTPDIAWENTLSASVASYIQVSLFCELLYDKEIDLRGRFREILGLGVTYKLF